MNKEMLAAFTIWGDRANRDTSHLMDIMIAGTIDQLVGHGTVVLRPARLEEIVPRIAARERDPDGGWKVTLLPGESEASPPETTSAEIATLAAQILGEEEATPGQMTPLSYNDLLAKAKRLAGSALTQRG